MIYKPSINPWEVPQLTVGELMALKALKDGVASQNQQIMALSTIVTKFAATYDWPYRPGEDGERNTLIALGRQFVGQRIMAAINRPMALAKKEEEDAQRTEPPATRSRRNRKPTSAAKPTTAPKPAG